MVRDGAASSTGRTVSSASVGAVTGVVIARLQDYDSGRVLIFVITARKLLSYVITAGGRSVERMVSW